MAAPNIVNVALITGKTSYAVPPSSSALVLIANPANSGLVYKINTIFATIYCYLT